MQRPRAFAFDLDGTLVDSRRDIAAACNHVLVQAGREPLELPVIVGFVGDGVRQLLARAFALPPDDAILDALVEELVRYYAAHPVVYTTWMPGALATLDAVADAPLALLTNKARDVTIAVLDALGARDRFAFVYAGGDGPLKPDPWPVTATARALGIPADSLWVVGDGAQDIQAARAAGATAVAVLGGFTPEARLRAAGPDALVASLSDLAGLRERAMAGRPVA
jgi:phosphoglycolate phosphatase